MATVPEPIRIVPMRDARAIAAAPAAQLVYNGGPLLASVEVFPIFWGAWWQGDGAALAEQVNGFFDFVLTSELIDGLAEYDAGGFSIAHGSRVGTITLADPAPAATVTDAQVQQLLGRLVDDGTVPPVGPNSLYFVYLPPDVAVSQGGGRSCQTFCGYHEAAGDLCYAVMPYPGCSGCIGDLQVFDALTSTSSHELCEAITDPVPGEGWYDDANGEIGDICAWQTRTLGDYTVQLEWSNERGACV